MKSKYVLVFLALWCIWKGLTEVTSLHFTNGDYNRWGSFLKHRPWIYDFDGRTSSWIICIVALMIVQPLWAQGLRLWLIPLGMVVWLLNPLESPLGYSYGNGWQPFAIAAVVFLAYVPAVRKLAAGIWRE